MVMLMVCAMRDTMARCSRSTLSCAKKAVFSGVGGCPSDLITASATSTYASLLGFRYRGNVSSVYDGVARVGGCDGNMAWPSDHPKVCVPSKLVTNGMWSGHTKLFEFCHIQSRFSRIP